MAAQFRAWIVALCVVTIMPTYAENMDTLVNNVFENLQADPNLLANPELTVESKQFIDKQVENFETITLGKKSKRKTKRSLSEDFIDNSTGTYLLDDITPWLTIPTSFSDDIVLFWQNSTLYAAALESSEASEYADNLIIFIYRNNSFEEIAHQEVRNALKIATIDVENYTLIAVAENTTSSDEFHEKSGIYKFNFGIITRIQTLDMHYASDITMWRIHDDIYMAKAHFMNEKTGMIHYEVDTPIYKWAGGHFDVVQSIKTKGARKITPFISKQEYFLAVANFIDDQNNTKIYSEIYKFDYSTETYQIHQRILTRACTDIEVFNLTDNTDHNVFLIVANSFESDSEGILNYATDSIIYKFVDDYFIPFQTLNVYGIEKWIPVQGANREFVLVALSAFNGVITFQFDGWAFVNTIETINSAALTRRGLKNIHSYNMNNTLTLVVANKNNNGNEENVYMLNFIYENSLNEIYNETNLWCEAGYGKVEKLLSDVNGMIEVVGKAERADITELQDIQIEQSEEISSNLESLSQTLDELDADLKNSLQSKILNRISADEIIFNDNVFVTGLNARRINGFDVNNLLENIIDITQPVEINNITFNSLEVKNLTRPLTINKFPTDTLLHNDDDLSSVNLTVNGTLHAEKGIYIDGKINGVTVDEENLLFSSGNQNIPQTVNFKSFEADRLNVQRINGIELSKMRMGIDRVENLKVKKLLVDGYINDVDIPTLDKYALKITGNQIITAPYIFDDIQGANLEVEGEISGKKISNMVPIDGGRFDIKQSIFFQELITVNNLTVLEHINGIKVIDGKPAILLKNSSDVQEIMGNITFDDLELVNPISLKGKIRSNELRRINPIVSVNEELVLEGDRTILGEVDVDKLTGAHDIITPDGAYSLNKLQNAGLKLTDREIQPHLHFVQQLEAEDIFVDRINGRDPVNYVVNGGVEKQIITGVKTFESDISITGSTNVFKINNIAVGDLEQDIMTIDGDQTVTGKHHIQTLILNPTSLDNVTFGARSVAQFMSPNVTTIGSNTIVKGDLAISNLTTKNITVKGLVNNLNFDEIVADSVMKGDNSIIEGYKIIKNLTVNTLTLQNGFNLMDIDPVFNLEKNELVLEGPLHFSEPISIENLYFEKQCNGMTKEEFGRYDVDENGTLLIHGDREFDTIVVYGKTFIESNKINNLDINTLTEETVKIDEPWEFDTVIFEQDVISNGTILLDGHIENVDLDNIVLSDSTEKQIIYGKKTFLNNLTVDGNVYFEGLVNGVNLTEFCEIANQMPDHVKNLVVEGDAYFAKGPNADKINGLDVKKIWDNAWINGRETVLAGYAEFENVTFKNDVEVGGFLDNVSLPLISENYFSKSKEQTVTAKLHFDDGIILENHFFAPKAEVGGNVNNVNLEEFVRTALIDNYDQVFEDVVFFESCQVDDLLGNFKVNQMNLETDVLRYDKVNMVTGPKTFNNLNVDNIKINKNIKIQGVDVLNWFKNAVLQTGSYNITGTKYFTNVIFEDELNLEGTINGLVFNNERIMLRNESQTVTGRKTFISNPRDPVTFKSVKLKGLLNNIDINELINNQAYKNKDNVFQTPINFYTNLSADNLIITRTFQGVNVSELITNLTNLGAINNLMEKYNELLLMSHQIGDSLKNQAYFLNYFKVIQDISPLKNSRKISYPDGVIRIGSCMKNGTNTLLHLYGWDRELNSFQFDGSIKFAWETVKYFEQILMDRYLYVEDPAGMGHFYHIENTLEYILQEPVNNTKATTSFMIPIKNETCTLFIFHNCNPKIFCENYGNIALLQVLEMPNALKASSITIRGVLYLIIINGVGRELESNILLWKFNIETNRFEEDLMIYTTEPRSISTIYYENFYYLAIASGHLPHAIYSGSVEIRRFDEVAQQFLHWQIIELEAPSQVEFAVLPSNELILYVVTDNPTQPMIVYRYQGIAGFGSEIVGATLPKISHINQFTGAVNEHFVVAQSHAGVSVIRAIFKGQRLPDA